MVPKLVSKKLLSAIGALFLVLGAVFPLLGLSYVLYWGTIPQPLSAEGFPLWSFWLGALFLIVGILGASASATVKEPTT